MINLRLLEKANVQTEKKTHTHKKRNLKKINQKKIQTTEKMNRLYTSGDFSSSCSSESDDGSSTDDECHEKSLSKERTTNKPDINGCGAARKSISQNILFKLQNREV